MKPVVIQAKRDTLVKHCGEGTRHASRVALAASKETEDLSKSAAAQTIRVLQSVTQTQEVSARVRTLQKLTLVFGLLSRGRPMHDFPIERWGSRLLSYRCAVLASNVNYLSHCFCYL